MVFLGFPRFLFGFRRFSLVCRQFLLVFLCYSTVFIGFYQLSMVLWVSLVFFCLLKFCFDFFKACLVFMFFCALGNNCIGLHVPSALRPRARYCPGGLVALPPGGVSGGPSVPLWNNARGCGGPQAPHCLSHEGTSRNAAMHSYM